MKIVNTFMRLVHTLNDVTVREPYAAGCPREQAGKYHEKIQINGAAAKRLCHHICIASNQHVETLCFNANKNVGKSCQRSIKLGLRVAGQSFTEGRNPGMHMPGEKFALPRQI